MKILDVFLLITVYIVAAVLIVLILIAVSAQPPEPAANQSRIETPSTVPDYHLCLYRALRKADQ